MEAWYPLYQMKIHIQCRYDSSFPFTFLTAPLIVFPMRSQIRNEEPLDSNGPGTGMHDDYSPNTIIIIRTAQEGGAA